MQHDRDAGLRTFAASSRLDLIARVEAADPSGGPVTEGEGVHRLAVIADGADEMATRLARAVELLKRSENPRINFANRVFYAEAGAPGQVAFVFPGYGGQQAGVMAELCQAFPRVSQVPDAGADASLGEITSAVLAANLAIHELLATLGVRPDTMVGHSYGENAALVVSGMIADRKQIFDILGRVEKLSDPEVPPSALLAVSEALLGQMPPGLYVALDNCPAQAVVCGDEDAIAALQASAAAMGEVAFRLPHLEWAVHTPRFPVPIERLQALYRGIRLQAPSVPVYCCATAEPFPGPDEGLHDLLAAQWVRTVRFRETIERMYADGVRTFIEAGPGGRLSGFVRNVLKGREALILPACQEGRPALETVQVLLARLFVAGIGVDLERYRVERGVSVAPVSLPHAPASVAPEPALEQVLRAVEALTGVDAVDPDQGFFQMGLTSITAVELVESLCRAHGWPLSPVDAFDHPTPRAMARAVEERLGGGVAAAVASDARSLEDDEAVAVVGVACRFPGGADTAEALWDLLVEGRDAVAEVSEDRWKLRDLERRGYLLPSEAHVRFGGFLADVRGFDAAFFGISPKEAATLDPQQRLLLEVAWEALENAAVNPRGLAGSATGVFVGISGNDYLQRLSFRDRIAHAGYLGSGNAHSIAAGRVSHLLGLRGPCMSVDTACSSSLVAVHMACQSLRLGESDLALAGGVNLLLSPETSIYLARAQALSEDGRCRTFDERANGYVRAEGCGVVVLKRLRDAVHDGDMVWGVVRGSAINHDGASSGLTVPSGTAQEAVIRAALAAAGVEPAQVGYVEAHGTGTALGDPIEVAALGRVFGAAARETPLRLGALKSNLGHTEAAAGVAGLIKVLLQMRHRTLAASLHVRHGNPRIDWERLPVEVVREAAAWASEGPRIAGVSSFGLSGTNAHVVVEEGPGVCGGVVSPWAAAGACGGGSVARGSSLLGGGEVPEILPVSARTAEALVAVAERVAAHLADGSLADVAHTLRVGRASLPVRAAVVASTVEEAVERLRGVADRGARETLGAPRIAFLFSGQGSQRVGMGRELYQTEEVFRAAIDECAALFAEHLDVPLATLLFEETGRLDDTRYTQPALFAVEYALARLWAHWGVEPDAVLGHSIGEYVAACLAGVFSLEDAARVVAARGRLMGSLPAGGGMLVVRASEGAVADVVVDGIAVAAVNGPESVVLSGPLSGLDEAARRLAARGVSCKALTVSHAFHSSLMDPILAEFEAVVASVTLRAPVKPLMSNLTGRRAGAEVTEPSYWVRQLRQGVRFMDGVRALAEEGVTAFVEVGPAPALLAMAPACVPELAAEWLASLRPPRGERAQMLESLGRLWERGAAVRWAGLARPGVRRVALPTYPFQHQDYWIDPDPVGGTEGAGGATLLGERLLLAGPGDASVRFESRVSTTTVNFLEDHWVLGERTLPVSAFLAMSLDAAAEVGGGVVEGLEIERPMPLKRRSTRVVQTVLEDGGRGRIFSYGADGWVEHASFMVRGGVASAVEASVEPPLESVHVDGASLYAKFREAGFEHGPRFQAVSEAWLASGRCLGRLRLPAAIAGPERSTRLHAVLVDGCVQLVSAMLARRESRGIPVLRTVERAAVAGEVGRDVWVVGCVRDAESVGGGDGCAVDVLVVDSGRTVAVIEGMDFAMSAEIAPAAGEAAVVVRRLEARDRARAAAGDERVAAMRAYLELVAGEVMGVRAVDPEVALQRLGFDSMMAVQMATLIQRDLVTDLPAVRILEARSLSALAGVLVAAMDGAGPTAVQRVEGSERCELSYGQSALWFLWRLAPESEAYNQSLPMRVPGMGDAERWRDAWGRLVERHAQLRTTFAWEAGGAVQHVGFSSDFSFVDAAGWSEAELLERMVEAHRAPFDLEKGPVARARFYSRADGNHALVVTMHHIVCDAWSLGIMLRELPMLYAGEALEPVGCSYHDFVRWQRALCEGPRGEELLAFWRDELRGPLPVLELPTDRPRPAVRAYRGDSCRVGLDASVSDAVWELAKAQGVTAQTVFMAAFLSVLRRWSASDDIVIGVPTAGRTRAEFTPVVGYFVDPLVIRASFSGGERFVDLVQRVRETTLRALEHAEMPFPLLVEKLRPARDPARSPVFDVTFNYVKFGGGSGGGKARAFEMPQADGKFDLTLSVMDSGEGFELALGYSVELFERATVERFGEHLARFLGCVAERPESMLDAVPLGDGAACALRPAPEALTPVHEMFLRQAALGPERPALTARGVTVSYGELRGRAMAVAERLRGVGVGADTVVAIVAERSVEAIAAMLGVMAAGGAYLPIDPASPPRLVAHMLSFASVVMAEAAFVEGLPASTLVLDDAVSDASPSGSVGIRDLAYVMFTSGSTGLPKGVGIEHRSLSAYAQSIIGDLGFEVGQRFAHVSTLAADLGNTVLFGALCCGGWLHLLPEEAVSEPRAFASYMSENAIDWVKIVPSHLAALTADVGAEGLPRVGVVLGGEGVPCAWVARLSVLAPGCRFFNHYGPTETTVGVMTCALGAEELARSSPSLPLRLPIAGCSTYVLDARLQPVPPGVPGELHIGGTCVARGYLNDEARTQEKFIENPFDGGLMYKSGDLARVLPSGNIEILGRVDRQVKIGGFRIEPGQVEAALRRHPAVEQCVVLREGDALAAYVAVTAGSGPPAGLRQLLRDELPRHMVPRRVVVLDRLPLTRNGKIDTAALQAMSHEEVVSESAEGPRDVFELRLAEIWSELLGVRRVGIHESFFDLGGHSLLAVRLLGRVRDAFGRSLPLGALYARPTVEAVARLLREGGGAGSALVPIRKGGDEAPLFCFPGAGGNVVYFHGLARHMGSERPMWALQALGLDGEGTIPSRVEEVAERYLELVRGAQAHGPYHLVGHSFGGLVVFELARRLAEMGEEVALAAVLDNAAPGVEPGDAYAGWTSERWLRHVGMRIEKLYGCELGLEADGLTAGALIDRLIAARLLPEDTPRGQFARFIEIYKANAEAGLRYVPAGPLPASVRLVLVRAAERDADLVMGASSPDGTLGWARWSLGEVEVVTTPGTHLSMMVEPNVATTAAALQGLMERVVTRLP